MQIAIVDDSPQDLELLQTYVCNWLSENQGLLTFSPALFTSGEALLESMADNFYDIIFLDIYMDGISGMDAAMQIRTKDQHCRLVFTTSTADFAAESYCVEASYYLVKPYSYENFSAAMRRCCAMLPAHQKTLLLPNKTGGEALYLQDIVYTEYGNRRISIHLENGSCRFLNMKQSDFADALLKYTCFCDCIKGVLVNFDMVELLEKDRFLMKTGEYIPISRLKYQNVREQFLNYSYAKTRGEEYVRTSV